MKWVYREYEIFFAIVQVINYLINIYIIFIFVDGLIPSLEVIYCSDDELP